MEGEREVLASELEERCGDLFDAFARGSVGVTELFFVQKKNSGKSVFSVFPVKRRFEF